MGKREKAESVVYHTHRAYFKKYKKKVDLMLVENVTEYGQSHVQKELGDEFGIQSTYLDPRVFGLGVARSRVFLLCWRKTCLRWVAPWSLNEFVSAFVAEPTLTARNYFWQRHPEAQLTPAEDTCWQLNLNQGFHSLDFLEELLTNQFQLNLNQGFHSLDFLEELLTNQLLQ